MINPLHLLISVFTISVVATANAEAYCAPREKDVLQALEARRGNTKLSVLATSMSPGSWAKLKTTRPGNLWSAPPPSKGLHIGTWSDDAHWDSRSAQFLFFGVRQTRKFVVYSEEENAWRVIQFYGATNAPDLEQQFGHQYSFNALDPERSRFYTGIHRYDIASDSWVRLPEPKSGLNSMVYEYFSAMNGLLSLSKRPAGTLLLYDEQVGAWKSLGVIPVHGHHSVARHNPFRQEVLFGGGNETPKSIVILSKNGSFKRMKDFPESLNIRHTVVTVDPISGNYLFMLLNIKKLYEFDSRTNDYRLVNDFKKTAWPFHRREAPVVAFIPEYGVTMWVDQEVYLYKHQSSGSTDSGPYSILSACADE